MRALIGCQALESVNKSKVYYAFRACFAAETRHLRLCRNSGEAFLERGSGK